MKNLKTVGDKMFFPSTSVFGIKSIKWTQTHIQLLTPEKRRLNIFWFRKETFSSGFKKSIMEYYMLTMFLKLDKCPSPWLGEEVHLTPPMDTCEVPKTIYLWTEQPRTEGSSLSEPPLQLQQAIVIKEYLQRAVEGGWVHIPHWKYHFPRP